MQVIVCDDDIENLNEMIQVCYDVLAKGTEVRGFSDASMLAEALQAGMVQPRSEERRVGKECVSTCRSR